MRFDAVIELVTPGSYTADAIGQQIATGETRHTVFANEFSMSATEVYAAGAQGLKPERQYQVRAVDYAGETKAFVDDVEYRVIRQDRRGEFIRLTLERVMAHG